MAEVERAGLARLSVTRRVALSGEASRGRTTAPWLPEGHLAWFVIEAINELELD